MTTKNTTQTHTPGPWAASDHCESDDCTPAHCWIKSGPKQIAAAFYGETDAERLANAALIAAAPELLGLLREAARLADAGLVIPSDTLRAMRAAIAKATGDTEGGRL